MVRCDRTNAQCTRNHRFVASAPLVARRTVCGIASNLKDIDTDLRASSNFLKRLSYMRIVDNATDGRDSALLAHGIVLASLHVSAPAVRVPLCEIVRRSSVNAEGRKRQSQN